MRSQRFLTVYIITAIVSMLSPIEALQCYVCENCIKGEEFNVLEICGANGVAGIQMVATTTTATPGTTTVTMKPLLVVDVGAVAVANANTDATTMTVHRPEQTAGQQQTDKPQDIQPSKPPPITQQPVKVLPTNTDDKDINDNSLEYSYEDDSESVEDKKQQTEQPVKQQQTEQPEKQQQTEQPEQQQQQTEQAQQSVATKETTSPRPSPTTARTTPTISKVTNSNKESSEIVNNTQTTIEPITLPALIDNKEEEEEYDYEDEHVERHKQQTVTINNILITNPTSSTANNASIVTTLPVQNASVSATLPSQNASVAATVPVQNASVSATVPSQNASVVTTLPVQNASVVTTLPVQNASVVTTLPVQNASVVTTLPVQNASVVTTLPVQNASVVTTLPVQNASVAATLPVQNASVVTTRPLQSGPNRPPADKDDDYYEEDYDEDYDEDRKRVLRTNRPPSVRQNLEEPVCYVIQMKVNNTLVTNRGCASMVRHQDNGEFLNCHDIYPDDNIKECYLCESNGCNKITIVSSTSSATSNCQLHFKYFNVLLLLIIKMAAISFTVAK